MEAIKANLYFRVRERTRSISTHRIHRLYSYIPILVKFMPGKRPTSGLGRPRRSTGDITATLYYIKSLRGISYLTLQFEDLLVQAGASAHPHRYLFSLDFLLGLHGLLKVIQAVETTIVGQDSISNLIVEWFLNLISLLLQI